MPKTHQLSVFLRNCPGELLKLCSVLQDGEVNILAISIQNAKDYVEELYDARERSGRRMVLAESYRGVLRESSDYSVIRLLVDETARAKDLLLDEGHAVEVEPVICLYLTHRPGVLRTVAERLAGAGINIDYVYGSATNDAGHALFVLHVPDLEAALALFDEKGIVDPA